LKTAGAQRLEEKAEDNLGWVYSPRTGRWLDECKSRRELEMVGWANGIGTTQNQRQIY